MELIVDLHVHSHFSRATSKDCTLEGLYKWGKTKGINVIGTGDFTHPGWFAEMRDKLEPAEGGLFRLKHTISADIDKTLPPTVRNELIRFVPTVEIATIYSKNGAVRKLHQLLVAPSFTAVSEINSRLERIGNLKADGRPILGLDSKELLRIALECGAFYIPAHIWTPWFGMFGSKSGFDSVEEAFEDLAPKITAIETGLSSDPYMNWRLSRLQNASVISNSDAHSPRKLGREATVMRCEPVYDEIIGAMRTNDRRLAGTIEFFPEEGKYHYDGHRACGVRFSPDETKAHNGACPKCGKPLVVGVDYRVSQLADQPLANQGGSKRVEYIVPLDEIVAELRGVKSANGKAVTAEYDNLVARLGSEFAILRKTPISTIRAYSPQTAQAIERLRAGEVHRDPGYDGVYGVITVFKNAAERTKATNQLSLL